MFIGKSLNAAHPLLSPLHWHVQILVQRLKVPPSINQFSKTLDKNQATELLKVLMKYQPEDKKAKQQRLKEIAAAKEAGKDPAPSKSPKVCKPLIPVLLVFPLNLTPLEPQSRFGDKLLKI